MRRVFWFLSIMCCVGTMAAQKASFTLDQQGCVLWRELLMRGDYWDNANRATYKQTEPKHWRVEKRETQGNETILSGTVFLPDAQLPFTERMSSKAPYEADYLQEIPDVKHTFTFRFYLPVNKYVGHSVWFSGKEFKLPAEAPQKPYQTLGSANDNSLRIQMDDGILQITSETPFKIHLADYRPSSNNYHLNLYFNKVDGKSVAQFHLSFQPYRFTPLDLRPACNMGFRDEVEDDNKGGWTDQGPANDLRMFPVGSQTFCNTTFDIVDPKKNAGKSCIVLGNSRKPAFPLHAEAKQTNAPHG
ncbi:MAG: hypothetical protein IJJ26_11755, partial [Victivallales bacterium]|nr:hypothetical protein [Victivallales bacterium]